ncbi:MAG: 7-cyano-7-deazaguanine synthase QueC [Thaumarchaeota archaeon]|nr:7-cyano-7-deazaguanine synthase QueC [Nitrososphaerota archaeon]
MGCSISGCIIFQKSRSQEEIQRIEQRLRQIMIMAEDRGRDSYGIVAFQNDGSCVEIKEIGKASESLIKKPRFINPKTYIVIANNRAEPTTEYVANKNVEDIQPFGNSVFISHNGMIANDFDLEKQFKLKRKTKIDSAILPPLLEGIWDDSLDGLQKILRDAIVGSFALAIVKKGEPNALYLACNYKPIFLEYDVALDVVYFTSLESYLQQDTLKVWDANPIRQLKPYSVAKITTSKAFDERSLFIDSRKMKALVVASAGLDSTTAAKVMMNKGYEVTLLHFKYRHRAEAREQESIRRIAGHLNCGFMFIDTTLFKDVIGHSRLTETWAEIQKERDGEAGAEFAHEWVPARNLIFLSIATGIAEAHGYDVIVPGTNLEESGAYPDNEMIFINKLNEVLPYATNLQRRVKIEMPVGNLMKHEIVKLGVQIGAPLHLTWSCYEGGEAHCGRCGPCYMRKKAFKINGLKDPVSYAESRIRRTA